MTKDRDFKKRVRDRMAKTGESYTAARAQLDTRSAPALPPIKAVCPVLRIGPWATAAKPHYVERLGFAVDWEWRATPHSNAVVAISRDGLQLMLVENDPRAGHAWVSVEVEDLHALAAEWNARQPDSAEVRVGPPYDIPTIVTVDPAGNEIHWTEPVSAAEQRARTERAEQMRTIIRQSLDAGDGLPTADELITVVGRPLGIALQVLNEFAEYEEATRPG